MRSSFFSKPDHSSSKLSLRYIKYDLGSEDLQLVKPIYDAKTGTFQGLEENIGLIRSNSDETFFNYGSDEKIPAFFVLSKKGVYLMLIQAHKLTSMKSNF